MSPDPVTTVRVDENSTLDILSKQITNSDISTFYWCFESNSTTACCTCGEQCSESSWTTRPLVKNTCNSCQYKCLLTIDPVSMKYNGGKIISGLRYFGRNATLAIRQFEVIPSQTEPSSQTESPTRTRQSYRIYYLVGSGAGVIFIIFLAIGVACKIKCGNNNSSYHHIRTAVVPSPSPNRK